MGARVIATVKVGIGTGHYTYTVQFADQGSQPANEAEVQRELRRTLEKVVVNSRSMVKGRTISHPEIERAWFLVTRLPGLCAKVTAGAPNSGGAEHVLKMDSLSPLVILSESPFIGDK